MKLRAWMTIQIKETKYLHTVHLQNQDMANAILNALKVHLKQEVLNQQFVQYYLTELTNLNSLVEEIHITLFIKLTLK